MNNRISRYFQPNYYAYTKQAAQPPMDPSMMAGGMPPMDPSMMGGMPPQGMPMDPSMMAGGAPPMDPAMMGGMPPQGMPMDPSMMAGGMPPMDPSQAAPPPADPAAAAADPAAAATGKTSKQQKEELMNNIQASLESIQDYVYNNLMILIQVAKALNVSIPAEMLVAPPNGKNMDIMSDPTAIAAAGGESAPVAPSEGGLAPTDLPPVDQAPSEAKMAMFSFTGIPSKQVESQRVKRAMNYMVHKERNELFDTLHRFVNNKTDIFG